MFALFTAWKARLDHDSRNASGHRALASATVVPTASHRERLLAMQVGHLQLCSEKRASQLAQAGIRTAGDLLLGDATEIAAAFGAPARARRSIRRFQAALRLAIAVEGMTPRDALLLIAIHRRSVNALATEHAATLRRDLERFSLSTQGNRLVGKRGLPSLRRIKNWIQKCQSEVQQWTTNGVAESSVAA